MEDKDISISQKALAYFKDALILTQYQLGLSDKDNCFMINDSKLKKQLQIDTLKCMLITSVMFTGYRFSKGRNHYLNYIKSLVQGSATGFVISIYYTREKMRQNLVERYLDNQSNHNNSQSK